MGLITGFEKVVRQDEPLAMHTWYQLGGPAEYFAEPEDPDRLIALIDEQLLRRRIELGAIDFGERLSFANVGKRFVNIELLDVACSSHNDSRKLGFVDRDVAGRANVLRQRAM